MAPFQLRVKANQCNPTGIRESGGGAVGKSAEVLFRERPIYEVG